MTYKAHGHGYGFIYLVPGYIMYNAWPWGARAPARARFRARKTGVKGAQARLGVRP